MHFHCLRAERRQLLVPNCYQVTQSDHQRLDELLLQPQVTLRGELTLGHDVFEDDNLRDGQVGQDGFRGYRLPKCWMLVLCFFVPSSLKQ